MSEGKENEVLSRMVTELEALTDKLSKLDTFIMSESYVALPCDTRMDLSEQWGHMDRYAGVLKRRIGKMQEIIPDV